MISTDNFKQCSICAHSNMVEDRGLICGLTNREPSFEGTCGAYAEDPELKAKNAHVYYDDQLPDDLAGQGKRFANHLLDMVFIYIFTIIVSFTLAFVLTLLVPSSISLWDEDNKVFSYVMAYSLVLIYYILFEATTGRTMGKLITRTRVIDQYGRKPNFKTVIIRSLCRLIPFEAFSFLGDSGWHDRFSKTFVVNIPRKGDEEHEDLASPEAPEDTSSEQQQ